MKLKKKLLSFRYSSNFFYNRIKLKKLRFQYNHVQISCHETCPVCGCSSGVLIGEVDRIGFPCDTVICDDCQLVFNNSYIANPSEFYSQIWGVDRWGDPEENFSKRISSDSYSWKRFAFVAKQLGSNLKKIQKILEVGCGDGCNLLPYHLVGKEVVGLDLDDRYLDPGRKCGMNLVEGGFECIEPSRTFDLAMYIHSFEHMLHLDSCVQDVSKYLSVGSYVYVEVPGIINMNQPLSNQKRAMGLRSKSNFLGYLQFQHNYHFDLSHIKLIWERNGFEMIKGDEWVRCIFKKNDNLNSPQPNYRSVRDEKIFNHLVRVESDFFSTKNIINSFVNYWR